MTWLLATAILLGGAVFFALRAATQGRLQVEAVLGRMSGYGYAPAPSGSDPRAWLRKIGYVAPGGRGEAAEVLRRKLAAAGWSKHLVPEDVAGLKIVLPAAAYGGMFVAAAFDVIPVLVAAVIGPRALGPGVRRAPGGHRHADARAPRQDRVGPADRARPAHPLDRGGHELRRGGAAAWCAGSTGR